MMLSSLRFPRLGFEKLLDNKDEVGVMMLDIRIQKQECSGFYLCIELPNLNPDTKTHL